MPASAISRCSRVAGCLSGRCHACCQGKDTCAAPPQYPRILTPPSRSSRGLALSPEGSRDRVAHLPEGHGVGAGLPRDGLPGGVMFQDDAIALQDHQWLPVQGQGARLGRLGHCEAQLSSIRGHLGHRVDSAQLGSPVGPSHCSSHLFSKGIPTLLTPSLCCSCCPELPFSSHPLPTLSPRKRSGRFQK